MNRKSRRAGVLIAFAVAVTVVGCGSTTLTTDQATTALKAHPGLQNENILITAISSEGATATAKGMVLGTDVSVLFRRYDDGRWSPEQIQLPNAAMQPIDSGIAAMRAANARMVLNIWLAVNLENYITTFDTLRAWTLLLKGRRGFGAGQDWKAATVDDILVLFPVAQQRYLRSQLPGSEEAMFQDAWKRSMNASVFAGGVEVTSSGVDGVHGTADDAVVRMPLDDNAYERATYTFPAPVVDAAFTLEGSVVGGPSRFTVMGLDRVDSTPFSPPVPTRSP